RSSCAGAPPSSRSGRAPRLRRPPLHLEADHSLSPRIAMSPLVPSPRLRGEGAMVAPREEAGEGGIPSTEFSTLPLTPTLSPLRCASRGEGAHRVRGANSHLKESITCL